MIDVLKKGLFFGMGLFEESREKVEALVDDLIKTGEVAREEKDKMVEKLTLKIKEQEQVISDKINSEIKKTVQKLGIPTKAEFDRLAQEVEALKKKLEQK